ncbi:methyltransferase domain-containing protein [Kordia sp. YSTF-M3]|uniref:Methyltransferase domain-containing protein n=1 Tax=Kordia aestuariivivens TaxID=2759037 RepID=A0ABR7QDV9_9FLAO|nr:methyltransferase domain-containing protein [Kordia aestuariivivens]MBC8756767.1 methyltransferase domain-containing protein [Kordia aestuariivivens]
MNWKLKASLQKLLHFTKIGDKLNHIPATLKKDYHKNVCLYQAYECLRKFDETQHSTTVTSSGVEMKTGNTKTALEIGTGYSLISPVILHLLGFDKIITVDISKDVSIKTFQKQIKHIDHDDFLTRIAAKSTFSSTEIKEKIAQLQSFQTLKSLFESCNITYIPKYTLSDIEKQSTSFDYICSQVVFEHIPPTFLTELFQKMKSWLTKDGFAVHTINFIDHFTNPGFFQDKNISEFNFLKYSDKTWKYWAGNDIAYTNRLSYLFYLELCKENDLTVIDFKGENYRAHNPLSADEIHEDVIKKYKQLQNVKDVCRYQRGTLIFKK